MSDKSHKNPDCAGQQGQVVLPRRRFIQGLGTGLIAAGLPAPAFAQGAGLPPQGHQSTAALEKARAQGLVVWHGDQEEDIVKFLAKFTEKTGIPTKQFRLLPGAALPRLQAELRMNRSEADVYLCADPGLMDQLREQGHLLKYVSPELAAYPAELKSNPEGFWTTYYLYFGPMMYSPKFVDEKEAPKTWADLLDPRWLGQIGFQNSSAGSQYGWWYVMKDIMPKDYWTKLGELKPRAYASSTQIVNDLYSGKLKIGGKVNAFQHVKAKRQGISANVVFPPEGTPAGNAAVGIISATKRPESAMIFMDYMLGKEGQYAFNDLQGSPSARADVDIPDVPSMRDVKVVLPKDFADYQSAARHAEFVALWNKLMGV